MNLAQESKTLESKTLKQLWQIETSKGCSACLMDVKQSLVHREVPLETFPVSGLVLFPSIDFITCLISNSML